MNNLDTALLKSTYLIYIISTWDSRNLAKVPKFVYQYQSILYYYRLRARRSSGLRWLDYLDLRRLQYQLAAFLSGT